MLHNEAIAIVIHNQGDLTTIFSPSCKSRKTLDFSTERIAGSANLSIGNRQAAETRNEAAFIANAVDVLPSLTMTPLNAGPMTFASCLLRLVSEFALTSDSRGITSGTTAVYAGWKKASTVPRAILVMYTCQSSSRWAKARIA